MSDTELSGQSELLFKNILSVIKSKFYLDENKSMIEYPDIIKWCLDNNLIQQAVTLYTERIPEYFYNKKFYTASEEKENYFKNEISHFNFHYRLFYNGLMSPAGIDDDSENIIEKLKNFISDNIPCLAKAKDIGELSCDSDIKAALELIINLKNELYDSSGERISSSQENKYDGKEELNGKEELKKFLNNPSPPKMADGFLKLLNNNKKVRCEILNIQYSDNKSDSVNNKINIIEFPESIDTENYTINIKQKDMKKIMRDYIYVKNIFRNNLNHASDDSGTSEILKEYMESYNYNVSENISLEEIKTIMKDIANKTENVSFINS